MERSTPDHLSQISTMWTMLCRAHAGADDKTRAQHALVERYGGATYRYLWGAVRDPEAAAELNQDSAVRLLRGDFRWADPGKGRFRDYLKTALIHMATDHRRAKAQQPRMERSRGESACVRYELGPFREGVSRAIPVP